MPRTNIPITQLAAFGGKDEDITYTALDATNEMEFVHPSRDCLLIIKNKHTSAQVSTLISVGDVRTFNRTGDITLTTAAGDTADKETLVTVPTVGFTQSDGKVDLDVTADTAASAAVIEMLPTPV